jgi:hypothetical protein
MPRSYVRIARSYFTLGWPILSFARDTRRDCGRPIRTAHPASCGNPLVLHCTHARGSAAFSRRRSRAVRAAKLFSAGKRSPAGPTRTSEKQVYDGETKDRRSMARRGDVFVPKFRNCNAPALRSGRLRTYPDVLDSRRMQQCLHDNAVLLGFLLESGQLLLRRLRRADVKIYSYVLKPDRDSF